MDTTYNKVLDALLLNSPLGVFSPGWDTFSPVRLKGDPLKIRGPLVQVGVKDWRN